jgi:hypothetical protein
MQNSRCSVFPYRIIIFFFCELWIPFYSAAGLSDVVWSAKTGDPGWKSLSDTWVRWHSLGELLQRSPLTIQKLAVVCKDQVPQTDEDEVATLTVLMSVWQGPWARQLLEVAFLHYDLSGVTLYGEWICICTWYVQSKIVDTSIAFGSIPDTLCLEDIWVCQMVYGVVSTKASCHSARNLG